MAGGLRRSDSPHVTFGYRGDSLHQRFKARANCSSEVMPRACLADVSRRYVTLRTGDGPRSCSACWYHHPVRKREPLRRHDLLESVGMNGRSAELIGQQIDRICESDRFRSAPQLAALLRSLATHFSEHGGDQLDQRGLAVRVFGLDDSFDPATNPRVRVQMTRLRQALKDYARDPGALDPFIIELPRRSYRLRIIPRDSHSHLANFRAVERATLVVMDLSSHGLEPEHAWIPPALTQTLLVTLGRFLSVTTVGPIARESVPAGGVAGLPVSQTYPESFVLDAGLQATRAGLILTARLLDGAGGKQVWSWSACLDADREASRARDGWSGVVSLLARELADETGVIAFEVMRTSAGKPLERMTVHQAIAAAWRYWITGHFADREHAKQSLEHVVAAVPHSGLAMAYLAAIRCEDFLASESGALTLPRNVIALFERARSLAPGHPWVELLRGFGLLFARQTAEIPAIVAALEPLPASGSFVGILGSLLLGIGELDRARSLLDRSLLESPKPPYFFRLYRAVLSLSAGDLSAASRALDQISNRGDPIVQLVRAAVACNAGRFPEARSFADEALALSPGLPHFGEIMLRRFLPDPTVDAIATAIEKLDLGWFDLPDASAPPPAVPARPAPAR